MAKYKSRASMSGSKQHWGQKFQRRARWEAIKKYGKLVLVGVWVSLALAAVVDWVFYSSANINYVVDAVTTFPPVVNAVALWSWSKSWILAPIRTVLAPVYSFATWTVAWVWYFIKWPVLILLSPVIFGVEVFFCVKEFYTIVVAVFQLLTVVVDAAMLDTAVSAAILIRAGSSLRVAYNLYKLKFGYGFLWWRYCINGACFLVPTLFPTWLPSVLGGRAVVKLGYWTYERVRRMLRSRNSTQSWVEALGEEPAPDMTLVDRELYVSLLKKQLVKPMVGAGDNLCTGTVTDGPTKRVMREIREMRTNLPLEPGSSVFVRYDKARPYLMRALITGPPDTPYDSGVFEFHITCNNTYPTNSPKVLISSTDGGRVRFNPNLYSNGKVCLSLLGTWSGVGCENWSSSSSLLQILVSIQGLILVSLPYFNEPGTSFASLFSNPFSGKNRMHDTVRSSSNGGYLYLRVRTLRVAVLNMIKNPPKGFEDVVLTHFALKKDYIKDMCARWLRSSEKHKDPALAEMKKLVEEVNHALDRLPVPSSSASGAAPEPIAAPSSSTTSPSRGLWTAISSSFRKLFRRDGAEEEAAAAGGSGGGGDTTDSGDAVKTPTAGGPAGGSPAAPVAPVAPAH